ncbi:MAG: ABC transporter permease [Oligoflexales bacterium]|nr:ABC transporter permease [Oligoflexales bacterium]
MSPNLINSTLAQIMIRPVEKLGVYNSFFMKSLAKIFYPPVNFKLLSIQMEFVGNRSFSIVILAGVMVGGIFGFQLGEIFRIFGAESMIGAAAGFALSRELAPMVVGFLVTGRAGSSMAAEIATMRVNEQIDAMKVMAVNPYSYLVAPRILASILMMPFLMVFFVIVGVIASFIIGIAFYDVDVADFMNKIQWIVAPKDIFLGIQKAAVFGLIFSIIGCYQGFFASGGAKGVGKATTMAVVVSYVSLIVADYVISYLQFL